MIPGLFAGAAKPVLKIGSVFAIGAGLAFGAVLVGFLAANKLSEIIVDRVQAAVMECNASWKSEIADANVKVALAQAAQANQAMLLNAELSVARDEARTALEELEKKNAALPGGNDGGLDVGRVRLLNSR